MLECHSALSLTTVAIYAMTGAVLWAEAGMLPIGY